ncbi:MAG TPA: acylphosphatase [Candidatus Eisenbacteria bacterium]|uniref:Acylphosphatase n=1 Tax=Eiseniibacteriota bacterium TaxID=2212470 RepID=A0A7V2F427_UNCEI|nr:acylphosphatase [Candidatus Eisenbacteria bacterium]
MRRIHAIVRGVVQGVGFRFFTKYLAERFGLSGFVRNRGDGTVELEAEGDEEAVSAFLEALESGPPRAAHVSGIEVEDLPVSGDLGGFRITH